MPFSELFQTERRRVIMIPWPACFPAGKNVQAMQFTTKRGGISWENTPRGAGQGGGERRNHLWWLVCRKGGGGAAVPLHWCVFPFRPSPWPIPWANTCIVCEHLLASSFSRFKLSWVPVLPHICEKHDTRGGKQDRQLGHLVGCPSWIQCWSLLGLKEKGKIFAYVSILMSIKSLVNTFGL